MNAQQATTPALPTPPPVRRQVGAPERRRATVLSLALAASAWLPGQTVAQGQVPTALPELERYCQQAPCRRGIAVSVRLEDGRVQEESRPLYRPAIARDSLSVLLGEELEAVAEFDGSQFLGWREPRRRESSRTPVLSFRLNQAAGDPSVSLQVSNAGGEPVKLRLFIRTPGAATGDYTSSCPVIAGGTVFEYWSQPVIEAIVTEAVLLGNDGALLCD
ncbi:MAG: hypothetical protein KF823_06450 [Xanthomonadales bacterium]|nr:hypothetical protein [Xanthomonadales bacterium]